MERTKTVDVWMRSDWVDWVKWHSFTESAISSRQPANEYLGFPRIYKRKPISLSGNSKTFVKVRIEVSRYE